MRFVSDISENKARVSPVNRIGSDVRIIMRAQICLLKIVNVTEKSGV